MEPCFHGGALWDAVPLDDLGRRCGVVNANVLDAWYPPAPTVVEALRDEWLLRTSPPTYTEPMEWALADPVDVPREAVFVGPGSSALMFLAFARWLTSASRILLIEPTYGEYAHLCANVVGCREPFDPPTMGRQGGRVRPRRAGDPNNPSGDVVPTSSLLAALPPGPRVWVDEAYLAYTNEPSSARS